MGGSPDATDTAAAAGETSGGPASAAPRSGARAWRSRSAWLVAVVVLAGLLGLQGQLSGGQQRTFSTVFMYVALAQAWNIIGGFAGYASFGHVVFFGLGGYVTAVLMAKIGLTFWLALPLSGLFAATYAIFVGLPLLRLKGHYFAIATLGVAEGTREVVTNLGSVTGGGAGISVPAVGPRATTAYLGNAGFYRTFLALAVAAVVAVAMLSRSRFGYALRAIHQDEEAAATVGVNTTQAKVRAFALSGLITGVVGATYAFQQVTIYPARLFDVEITVLVIVMVVIGGSGTVLGPVIGAASLQYLSEYLRQNYTDYHVFILGAIIIVAVLLFPQGVISFGATAWRTRRLPLLDTIRSYRL